MTIEVIEIEVPAEITTIEVVEQGPQGPRGTIAISTAEFDGGSAFTVYLSSPSLDLGSAA